MNATVPARKTTLPTPQRPLSFQNRLPLERQLLFVYGTLKRNEPNNYLLQHVGAQYVNSAETNYCFPMVIGNGLPFVINKPGTGKRIKGEVWSIPSMHAMRPLDRLEGHPHWYCRSRTPVTTARGTLLTPWLYFITEQYMPFRLVANLPFISSYTYGGHAPHSSEY